MYHCRSNLSGTATPFTSSLKMKQCAGEFVSFAVVFLIAWTFFTPGSEGFFEANTLIHFSFIGVSPVSYTHLDVYKRQFLSHNKDKSPKTHGFQGCLLLMCYFYSKLKAAPLLKSSRAYRIASIRWLKSSMGLFSFFPVLLSTSHV